MNDDKYVKREIYLKRLIDRRDNGEVKNGMEKYYIQSAYSLPDEEKMSQELASLRKIVNSFKKIVIVRDDIATYVNDEGIVFMGLFQFLKNEKVEN